MPHAYTEDQLVEQPTNLCRTRDSAAAGLPRLLSGQVALAARTDNKIGEQIV